MWEYAEAARLLTIETVASTECIFCQTPLARVPAEKFESGEKVLLAQVSLCPCCGWWTVYRVHQGMHPRAKQAEGYSGSIGCLKHLDLTDTSIPLDEVRKYLAAKQDKVFEVDPKVLENVVGSIFKDFGYEVRITGQRVPGKAGDDGVDVILDKDQKTIGVQVRRYKEDLRIEAEQIRSLVGAMVLGGHTEGMFVTTSKFRRGAVSTAERYSKLGFPVKLLDAPRFFEALGIAQQSTTSITWKQISFYILKAGVHIGTGAAKAFVEGEDLRDRRVIISTVTNSDLLELDEDGNAVSIGPDDDSDDLRGSRDHKPRDGQPG